MNLAKKTAKVSHVFELRSLVVHADADIVARLGERVPQGVCKHERVDNRANLYLSDITLESYIFPGLGGPLA